MTDYANPSQELLRSIDVHCILPQQEPFVMIGRLVAFSMMSSTTETMVREDNLFVDGGFLSASGILENIAQTCAARIGYYNKYVMHRQVQTGFIGAIKNFSIKALPPVGSTIVTKVDTVEEIFGMTLADASVFCDGELIADACIKLSVRNNE